jgi:hypothetical protein
MAEELKTYTLCTPAIRLVVDGIIIQCDDILVCIEWWWHRPPDHSAAWTRIPYREFLSLKEILLNTLSHQIGMIEFFFDFCHTLSITVREREGETRYDINHTLGKVLRYASRMYSYCQSEMERIDTQTHRTIGSWTQAEKTRIAETREAIAQTMRVCLITRSRINSCIPTLVVSPSLVCLDILFVKFNTDLACLANTINAMLALTRQW